MNQPIQPARKEQAPGPSLENKKGERPRIVLVVPRGEAVRNFLYSDTLTTLAEHAQVTLLSVVHDDVFLARFSDRVDEIIPLRHYPSPRWVAQLRTLTINAHDRWLWSGVAQNNWELRDRRAAEKGKDLSRLAVKAAARLLAFRPFLRVLTRLEQDLSVRFCGTDEFHRLFGRLRPDMVFNCSHIHGLAGELPLRVAKTLDIPTAGFIFSWDNLTSRSRIFVPYDHYLVWHQGMKAQLLDIYPEIPEEEVFVTGTPQFDFHLKPAFQLSRKELCAELGIDPFRPFVFYTAGIANHFYEEHRHVELVARLLDAMGLDPKPQLVVRTYVKGTSPEMKALAEKGLPDVIFPRVLWEPKWQTPHFEDLPLYSSLLRHCALGINAASTVSLELLLFDKPVINLDFDPPGSNLPWCLGYERHIRFDHYRPVAKSGAVLVARSEADMAAMLRQGLTDPGRDSEKRKGFLKTMFGPTLDGSSGQRVAETLLALAQRRRG
jgi:hypothetical protein